VSKRRSWTILLVPDEGSGPRQLRLGPGALRVLLVAGLVVLVLAGLGLGTYWRVARTARQAVALQEENARLQAEVQKVWELERLMADMLETDYKLRTRLGIPLPEDWPGYRFQLVPGPEGDTVLGETGRSLAGGRSAGRGREGEEGTMLFAWPVSPGFPTLEFGEGAEAAGMPHTGLDIAAKRDTPVRAAADGLVTSAGMDERYGFLAEISHGGGLVTRYGHNARLVVGPGQLVKKGDIIAYVGSTGRVTTGPHLHFEVQKNGRRFLGSERLTTLSPYDRAKSFEPLHGRNPTFAVGRGQRETFFEALVQLRTFLRAYRLALDHWRTGARNVLFPVGTWLMHWLHRVDTVPT